ncbi:hypothetical protein C8R44DRAFT_79712 [Mycena epipterygia]|nr:hypothetical protein C8R44DRAFT_79712 [Mycena epipterygia]
MQASWWSVECVRNVDLRNRIQLNKITADEGRRALRPTRARQVPARLSTLASPKENMSETDPVFPHHATPLKQYKTKKRRRDEAHDGEDGLVDEAKAKKKKRKHGEESGDNQAPPITTNLDTEATPVVTEKKRKKEKRKRTSDVTGEQPDQPDTATVEANAGTEKKKKKRKRDTDVDATAETRVEAGGEGKKKRKHHAMDAQDGVQVETAGTSTIALPIDPPAKKKKKSKEKANFNYFAVSCC